jgi:hypothetical protein
LSDLTTHHRRSNIESTLLPHASTTSPQVTFTAPQHASTHTHLKSSSDTDTTSSASWTSSCSTVNTPHHPTALDGAFGSGQFELQSGASHLRHHHLIIASAVYGQMT